MEREELKGLRLDVNKIKGQILSSIQADGKPIVAVIIALAELQKEMALLFFEEDEEERSL